MTVRLTDRLTAVELDELEKWARAGGFAGVLAAIAEVRERRAAMTLTEDELGEMVGIADADRRDQGVAGWRQVQGRRILTLIAEVRERRAAERAKAAITEETDHADPVDPRRLTDEERRARGDLDNWVASVNGRLVAGHTVSPDEERDARNVAVILAALDRIAEDDRD